MGEGIPAIGDSRGRSDGPKTPDGGGGGGAAAVGLGGGLEEGTALRATACWAVRDSVAVP